MRWLLIFTDDDRSQAIGPYASESEAHLEVTAAEAFAAEMNPAMKVSIVELVARPVHALARFVSGPS